MNAALVVALLIACAALLGVLRTPLAQRHRLMRIGLQIGTALLLYFCLFPPSADENFSADELVVVTPGATRAQLAALPSVATLVALPGVDADNAIERVPDLGTALRLHAGARRLRVVGNGLSMRDRDAARGLVAAFDAAPLPRGLVELDMPASVRAGNVWRIDGRVEAVAEGRVELRDPSGALVATQALGSLCTSVASEDRLRDAGAQEPEHTQKYVRIPSTAGAQNVERSSLCGGSLDAQGRFALHANAKGVGTTLFALKVLDRDGVQVDAATVPLSVRDGSPPKIVLLAGAPDAELKYLRRWAADAGLALTSRIALSDGVALSEGTSTSNDEAWRAADVAIVDERAWTALDMARKQALIAAVRDGLGLLLRATGPLPAPVAADWEELGFHLRAVDAPSPITLDKTLGLVDSGLVFPRPALAVAAGDAASLLRADDGSTLAWSRNVGRGRVALWLLADSYRLALGGAAPAFGTLWSDALATVARARGAGDPSLPASARVDERAVFCGVAAAVVSDEAGKRLPLSTDANGCAAYWPQTPGWHALLSGDQRWSFYVRARDEAVALAIAERRRATQTLVVTPASTAAVATRGQPLPRWPFFLVWLVVVAALWWLERGAVTEE